MTRSVPTAAEENAMRILREITGAPVTALDIAGANEGTVDARIDYGHGRIAVVEMTTLVRQDAKRIRDRLRRFGRSMPNPGQG